MYTVRHTYHNIDGHIESNVGTILLGDSGGVFKLMNGKAEPIAKAQKIKKLIRYDETSLLLLDSLNKPLKLNLEQGDVEPFTIIDDLRVFDVKGDHMFFYVKSPKRYNGIFQISTGRVLMESEKDLRGVIYKKLCFSGIDNVLASQSIDSGERTWSLDVSEMGAHEAGPFKKRKPGEVKKILGVWKDNLIVVITKGLILGLNPKIGELNWVIGENEFDPFVEGGRKIPLLGEIENWFLDAENGKLLGMQGRRYVEISLEARKVALIKDFENDFDQKGLFVKNAQRVNDRILFSAMRHELWKLTDTVKKVGYTQIDTIGIFDINSKEVIWTNVLEDLQGDFIKEIMLSGEDIYAHTNTKKLYHFKADH